MKPGIVSFEHEMFGERLDGFSLQLQLLVGLNTFNYCCIGHDERLALISGSILINVLASISQSSRIQI